LVLLAKSCGRVEDRDLVLVRAALPWAKLGAIAAFIAVGIDVQRLRTVLEAGHRNRDIGAVRAHINAFGADVVALQAALAFLLDEGIERVLS
jgi:hypothetical protein